MTERQQRILAIDDNAYTLRLVEFTLREAGFRIITAISGEEALKQIETTGLPDLGIVDLHMPGISGFEFAHRVHQYSDLPLIMLTAVNHEATVVEGLEEHAEDYIVKPFSPGELVARTRRVLRRIGEFAYDLEPQTRIDERLLIDFPNRTAIVEGKGEALTPTETKLLYILMRKAGSTVPTEYLLRRLWPLEPVFEDRLHVHLHRLRRKIEDRKDKTRPRYILSERGAGYSFRDLHKNESATDEQG
ncbi:MAG: response regulator transcription factor [Candidatus Promineofilum sp.]|nr:response regulator transcription factor [Promineifilum sp.]